MGTENPEVNRREQDQQGNNTQQQQPNQQNQQGQRQDQDGQRIDTDGDGRTRDPNDARPSDDGGDLPPVDR